MRSRELLLNLLESHKEHYKARFITKAKIIEVLTFEYNVQSCVDRQEVLNLLSRDAQTYNWPITFSIKKLLMDLKV